MIASLRARAFLRPGRNRKIARVDTAIETAHHYALVPHWSRFPTAAAAAAAAAAVAAAARSGTDGISKRCSAVFEFAVPS